MNTVDEWINLELGRLSLEPTKRAYASIFNDLVKRLGVHRYADPSEKIKKVAVLLQEAVQKQRYYKKIGIDLKSLEDLF